MIDTKQKILDAAERLIAEQGYDATSLRQIIGDAGVNLAAIHYHFGSKEELLQALVDRRAAPVNAERLELLGRFEAEAGSKPVPIERILHAFLAPMVAAANRNPQFVKVMGRIVIEGLLPEIVQKSFHLVFPRFNSALRRSMPQMPDEEFQWRIHFMTGVIAHAMCGAPAGNFQDRVDRMIRFLAGGFRAPGPEGGKK